MKKLPLLIVLLNLNLFSIYSQTSVCEVQEENVNDLNTISINKCQITENKEKVRKIKKTKNIRKRIVNKSRRNSNQLNLIGNRINLKIDKTILNTPNFSKELLFTLVEEIPMFESCIASNRENNIKCFKTKINKHFSKNFNVDKFINEDIDKKVYLQFSIDLHGKIINKKIKSKKINKLLYKELSEVMQKLPRFNPGKEKGLPVIVTYSFALNLTLD